MRLLFEGGIYFFGKPADINNGWIRYVQVRLVDAVSSSLLVLLLAMGTTHTVVCFHLSVSLFEIVRVYVCDFTTYM